MWMGRMRNSQQGLETLSIHLSICLTVSCALTIEDLINMATGGKKLYSYYYSVKEAGKAVAVLK